MEGTPATGRTHRTIVPRTLHTLLQANHVCGDLHDRRQQREGAVPARVQCAARLHHLGDQVLDTPSVVLQRQVELNLATSEAIALPLGDDLRATDVPLVTEARSCSARSCSAPIRYARRPTAEVLQAGGDESGFSPL